MLGILPMKAISIILIPEYFAFCSSQMLKILYEIVNTE